MALLTMQEYLEKKKKDDELQHAISYVEYMRQNEIAPVKLTNKPSEITAPSLSDKKDKDEGLLDFFQKGAFEDGYQFGDVTKSILGTTGDAVVGVAKGIGSLGEGIVDLGKYGVAGVADVIGKDKYAEQVRKNAQENSVEEFFKGTDDYLNQYSVLGRTSDAVMQGVGQVGAIILTGGVAGALGAGAVGATVATSGLMGLSSAGSGMSEAYKGGATDKEATIYGISKGVIDAGSELIFGGLGKAVNAVGLSKGISSLDDVFAQKLSSKLSNQVAKNFAEFGVKASAEGFEEVIAGLGSAVAKKLTYMDEEELGQIVKDENLLEQFVVGTVTSGMIQSGYIPAAAQGSLKEANETGTDFITGYTQNEQAVIDKEVENRIKERETDGKKLTNKEISSIEEQVKKDLDKGYINIDTIESTLGGETYNKYKSLTEQEETLTKKLEELEKAPNTVGNAKQYEETQKQLEELKNKDEKTKIKEQLSKEVKEMTLTDRLSESYNEKSRRSQAFEADLTKYDAKQQEVIKKATESGILNNTNRTHEFVDMVAKISADKGVSFDFTNNAKLKETGFALEGKTVNGYVKDGNIAVNIDSAKALNTVVGHEITHVLEGTELYTELQNVVKEFATKKGEYQTRYDALAELYKDVDGAVIENELTADLVGEYLFTDSDFVSRLSVEKPNIFQKIYEEIKYLAKLVTGSKEARELEKVKRAFDKAYKESTTAKADTKYSFAGENAETANKSQLQLAKEMESNGSNSEEIRKATGWHKGYDGEWRFEIDDSQMEILDTESNYMKLDQILKHDKLFEAYPILRKVDVVFQNLDKNYRGNFNRQFFTINLSSELKNNSKQLQETLIHEVQHVIQQEEGFANGSSIEYWNRRLEGSFDSRPNEVKKQEKELRKQYFKLLETNGEFVKEMENLEKMTPTVPRGQIDWETFEQIEDDPIEWQEFDAERERLEEKYGDDEVFDFLDLKYKLNNLQTKGRRKGSELYYDTAGEIEARETTRRLPYNEADRMKYQPRTKYENLGRDNVVFANYSLGEQSAKAGDYRVYGKDIALEAHTQETAQEGVAEIAPTTSTVEEMPIRSDYAPPQEYMSAEPEVAPVVEEVTPAAEDNERILGEDLTKKNADRIRTIQAEIKGHHLTKDITKKEFDEKIAQKESQYESLSRKDTKKAVDLRNQITRLETKRDSLLRGLDGKIERANKRIESIENESRFAKRITKQNEYRELFGKLMGDTSTWKDKKMGIQYQTNTFHRNLRDIVRDASGKQDIARADAIYDELQGSVNRNEAKKNREANEVKNVFREMKINNAESTYIQMLGELRHNPDTTLTKDVVDEFYKKNKGKIDVQKVDKAIDEARKLYDSLYDRVNVALSEHGFKEIGYRKGYFPHFTDPKRNWLAKLLNWKVNNDEIPTDIAGLTEMFEPQRTWQSFDKHRKTDTTDYNFLKGLDNYVNGSLDWIYHIEDIQKHRAFENEIRYRHSSEQVQKKIDEYRNNPMLSAEEVDTLIQSVLREAKNPLNNFVTDLHTRTNILAGKKSSKDRNMESDFNRHAYSVMTNITNRVTANQVVGSISSAMTNFIPITQSWGQVNPTSSLVGMKKTIQSYMRDDGVIAKSDFLTNRLAQNEALYKDAWDKIGDKVGGLMEIVDNFTSQTVWRSKYYENIKNGMTESQAIKDADQFAENVIGGRSKGNMPTIFHAKNPVTKMLTAFQLEVANQYGYIFKDMPQDIGKKAIGKLTKGYATMFIGAYAYNALYSSLVGRDSALDPLGIIEDFIRDLGGDDDEEEDVAGAIGGLASSVADEIPFVGGLLGGGRIPISSALPYNASISDAYADVVDKDWKSVLDELSKPLYYGVMPMGGGQVRKTVQGLSMFDKDLPVSGSYTKSGNLRFPVEDTFLNKLQAGVFGQYASSNAREYFDRGQAPLKEKQIQEYKDLELPIRQYWDYREGLKEQETLEDKFEYIADLDVSVEQKNIMINNIVDRKEKVDMSNYDDFANYEEFDWYTKNTEKYNFLEANGVSYSEYKADEETKKEYDNIYSWYKNNPDKVTLSKAVTSNVIEYRRYASDLDDIRADKDENGKTISGSAKQKKTDYINSLDLDYGQKIILYRSLFDAQKDKDEYNADIVDYLNERDDISEEEMISILEALDMQVLSDGSVVW